MPPREDAFFVVAGNAAATAAAVARLHARGSAGASAAPPDLADDRTEIGPPRRVAWRAPEWLTTCLAVAALPAGASTLDVACGSGRVVAALAARGFAATGLDLLPDALARARRLAAAAGVAGSFVVADAERRLPFRAGSLALVTGFRYLDRALFPALVDLLAPGGELWWETFDQAQAQFGHPRRPAYLLAPGELAALGEAAGLTVLATRETCPPGGPALSAIRAVRSPGAPGSHAAPLRPDA